MKVAGPRSRCRAEVLGVSPQSCLRLLPVTRPHNGEARQPDFLNFLTC